MMNENRLLPLTQRREYLERVSSIRVHNPVPSDFLGMAGYSDNGQLVLIPGSFREGYRDALTPPSQRRYLTVNLFIIGWLSDGTMVFPPSYWRGFNYGVRQANEVKFAVLAEGERRLFEDNQELGWKLERTETQLKEEIREMQKQIDALKSENSPDINN